ncbi:MAG: flavodoxin domain-containing protein [Planctomycetota bacterium]|nr:flavodoxin domain-containing protein [Planctomycetota bacterium]
MSAPIAVLFGTETGNSQDCAERLATAIRDLGFSAESIDMGHYDADRLGGEALALIVTSTYGNGDPPANAEALLNHVSNTSTQLEGVSFGVCALGDSTYPLFAQCGRDFDERM